VLLKVIENRGELQHQTGLVESGFQTNDWTLKGRNDHMYLRNTWSLYEEFSEAHCIISGQDGEVGMPLAIALRHSDRQRRTATCCDWAQN
jgi:hypothetical protein